MRLRLANNDFLEEERQALVPGVDGRRGREGKAESKGLGEMGQPG